jgi:hypothetical protein
LVTGEGGDSPERLHDGNAHAWGGGGTTSGRPKELWRVLARRSWSGGELGRRHCDEGGLGGRSERPVYAAVLGGQGSVMGSTKRRMQRGSLWC